MKQDRLPVLYILVNFKCTDIMLEGITSGVILIVHSQYYTNDCYTETIQLYRSIILELYKLPMHAAAYYSMEKQRKYRKLHCPHCERSVPKSTWYSHYREFYESPQWKKASPSKPEEEFNFDSSDSDRSDVITDQDGVENETVGPGVEESEATKDHETVPEVIIIGQ
jgi:hypothetical protein